MCLLICHRGGDGSLVVAANRDERYDRPTSDPFVWRGSPRILAGRDELAGGTWLAVNDCGVVAAVTNRATAGGDEPAGPSRGMLPVLACRCTWARQARGVVREHLRATRYNAFNLFVADAQEAFVIASPAGQGHPEPVEPGIHVVGNVGWDDPSDPRVERARALLGRGRMGDLAGGAEALIERLKAICRDHEGAPGPRTLCAHGESAGTVSSTVLVLDAQRRLRRYLYAPGPPCRGDYREVPAVFQLP